MDEKAKKFGVGAVVLIALIAVVYEGMNYFKSTQLQVVKTIGHGTPGHGMKAAMMAAQKGGNPTATPPPTTP